MTNAESPSSKEVPANLAQEIFTKVKQQGTPDDTAGWYGIKSPPITAMGSTWYLKAITDRENNQKYIDIHKDGTGDENFAGSFSIQTGDPCDGTGYPLSDIPLEWVGESELTEINANF